jgi:polysaccharide export outer membrane protein
LIIRQFVVSTVIAVASAAAASAQVAVRPGQVPPVDPAKIKAQALPPGYVIGPGDVLAVVFWRDNDMSAEVIVRPDGMVSLPLLNDVKAAGFTPDQLRENLIEASSKYVEDPTVAVLVKDIKSRNVFITGQVARPNTYPLHTEMTVLQLIALAGGVLEYSDSDNIVIIRPAPDRPEYLKFNYNHVLQQKNPRQNILLKPGDTVVVP